MLSIELPLRGAYSFLYLRLLIAILYSIAWVSLNFFEYRFLRLKRHFGPVFPEAAFVPEPASVGASG